MQNTLIALTFKIKFYCARFVHQSKYTTTRVIAETIFYLLKNFRGEFVLFFKAW